MDQTARTAAETAGERARKLAERRERLLAGVRSTPLDVLEASRWAVASLARARAAHARASLAHDRAAVAHDRAAVALEARARRSADPIGRGLLDQAQRHRRAAGADREAANEDRAHALGDRAAAPEPARAPTHEAGPAPGTS